MQYKFKLDDVVNLFGEKKLITTPQLSVDFFKDNNDCGFVKYSRTAKSYYAFYQARLEDYIQDKFDFDFYTERVKVFLRSQNIPVYETATLRDLLLKVGVGVRKTEHPYLQYTFPYQIVVIDPKANRTIYRNALIEKSCSHDPYLPANILKGVYETKKAIADSELVSPEYLASILKEALEEQLHPRNLDTLVYSQLRSFSPLNEY